MTILGAFASYLLFQCPGNIPTSPTAINNAGVITGYCNGNGFIRHANGTFTLFNAGGPTFPTAININGDVVGYYDTGTPTLPKGNIYNAFLRTPDGKLTRLFTPLGQNASSWANDINSNGVIIGVTVDINDNPIGFVRAPDGTFISMFLWRSTPIAINDAGDITGATFDISDIPHAFLGNINKPPNVQGIKVPATNPTNEQLPLAINHSGTIIGFQTIAQYNPDNTYTYQSRGFTATLTSTTMFSTLLPTTELIVMAQYPKTRNPYGGGINTSNTAVIQDQYRAPDGTITTINLGYCTNVMAQGINTAGLVTGSCTQNNQSYGFIWLKTQHSHLTMEVER